MRSHFRATRRQILVFAHRGLRLEGQVQGLDVGAIGSSTVSFAGAARGRSRPSGRVHPPGSASEIGWCASIWGAHQTTDQ